MVEGVALSSPDKGADAQNQAREFSQTESDSRKLLQLSAYAGDESKSPPASNARDASRASTLAEASAKDDQSLKNKLGNLTLVDASGKLQPESEEDTDSSDHVNVGGTISWDPKLREMARPKNGEGYYDVMKNVGEQLLGHKLSNDEIQMLVAGAKALQEHRGKGSSELNSRDELLPKNEQERDVFLNNMDIPANPGKLSEREKQEVILHLFAVLQSHQQAATKDQIVLDTRPVKDQPVVSKVVPNAVYIDSSNIEGGQGYRRTEKCEPETQNYWLSKPTAEALMRAQAALIKAGKDPLMLTNMNGAGRRALDRELISKCAPDQPHAKKHSQHEDGISVDVANYDNPDVRKAIEKEGFVHNVPGDRPHFTWLGKKK